MPGWREAALAGAALVLTGGVVYVIWKFRDTKQSREAEKVPLKPNLNAEKPEKLVEKEIRTETAHAAPTVSQQRQVRGSQVLVLGLDGAGKTSLLQCFVTGSTEQEVSPTQGFHAVSINREELHIEFLERHFSSTPSPRILELARPRESKTVWLTTPEKVTWGNQETIWSPSRTALIAVPTTRILALSQPKKDLSALSQDQLRKKPEGIEEAKKRSACGPSSTAQYEHVARLANPNVRHRSTQAVRCLKEQEKPQQALV